VSYLAQTRSGCRLYLASDLTQSAGAVLAAFADESDPTRRDTLLGLLAQSLVQQYCQLLKVGDSKAIQLIVAERSPAIPRSMGLSAA
jgi:hypothetical protein